MSVKRPSETHYMYQIRRIVIVIAAILLSSAVCGGTEAELTSADAYFERACAKLNLGELDAAILDFSKVLELDPRNVWALNYRAIAQAEKGNYDDSLSDFSDALKIDPNNARTYVNRGNVMKRKADLDGAMADYSKAIGLDPRFGLGYTCRGSLLYAKGDFAQAIIDQSKAIELEPEKAQLYIDRATSRGKAGDLVGAVDDFTAAISLAPDCFQAYLGRGVARGRLEEYDGMIADYLKVIELNPRYRKVYMSVADGFVRKGEMNTALIYLAKAAELDPNDPEVFARSATIKNLQGDFASARDEFAKSIQRGGRGGMYLRFAVFLLSKRLGCHDSEEELRRAVGELQDSWVKSVGRYLIGEIGESMLIELASAGSRDVVRGQQCEAYYYAGIMHLLDGDAPLARGLFEKCLATEASNFTEYEYARAELLRMGVPTKKERSEGGAAGQSKSPKRVWRRATASPSSMRIIASWRRRRKRKRGSVSRWARWRTLRQLTRARTPDLAIRKPVLKCPKRKTNIAGIEPDERDPGAVYRTPESGAVLRAVSQSFHHGRG